MTDATMLELDAMHAQMIAEHDRGDRSGCQDKNRAIHFRIVDLAANTVLKVTYANFMARVMRARATNNYDASRWPASRTEHEEIMAAPRARDPQGAAAALHAIRGRRALPFLRR